jgi:hypothetical protein
VSARPETIVPRRRHPTKPLPSVQPESPPQLVTLKEAAKRLSLSYWAVRSLAIDGTLPPVRLHDSSGRALRKILIDPRDIDALIARSKHTTVGTGDARR